MDENGTGLRNHRDLWPSIQGLLVVILFVGLLTISTSGCENCSHTDENISGFSSDDYYTEAEEDAHIAEVQEYIRQNNLTWTAGKTSVSGLKPEAFQRMLGAVPQEIPGAVSMLDEPVSISADSLPTTFDWRNNGGDWTTGIRAQGSCGSCWAFASTAVFESYQERRYGNPSLNPDYSEQYLVRCNTDGWNCVDGGWIAFNYFINKAGSDGAVGIPSESDYPYTASDGSCTISSGKTRYTAPSGAYWGYVTNYYSIPSVNQIKTAVYTYGPVYVGICANNLNGYTGGIFSGSATGINHAVVIVGWGVDSSNNPYWICKNSWDTWWGESGWLRIYPGANQVGYGAAYMYLPSLPAPTVSSITPGSGTKNSTVQITNLSGANFQSSPTVVLNRTGYSNITATNVNFLSTAKLNCTFNLAGATPGTWNVSVTNTDGKTGTLVNGFTVVNDLVATFYGVPETTVFPHTVHFYDKSTGNPVSWNWNFGDGNTSTQQNPSTTYYSAGNKTVTFSVQDGL